MYRRDFIYMGVVSGHLSETAREASGLGVAAGSGVVDGVRDNSDGSLQGGGGVADLLLGVVILLLIILGVVLNGLASDGSALGTVGLGSLGDNGNIDGGGGSGDGDGLRGTLAVTALVGAVAVAVASALGAIVLALTLAGAVAVVAAGGRAGLTDTLDGLGDSASGGLGGGGGGVLLRGAVALGTVAGDLGASRDGQCLLDGLVDSSGDGLFALGKGDDLVGGVVRDNSLLALGGGRVGTTGVHGDISSDGLASNATGLSIVENGGVNGAGLRNRTDNLSEDDGVSGSEGGLVGLGELGNGSLVTRRAVGDGGSTASDGLDDGGLDGQSGLRVGSVVVSAVVGVLGELVGVGHGGEHADAGDDGFHFEGLVLWGFAVTSSFVYDNVDTM